MPAEYDKATKPIMFPIYLNKLREVAGKMNYQGNFAGWPGRGASAALQLAEGKLITQPLLFSTWWLEIMTTAHNFPQSTFAVPKHCSRVSCRRIKLMIDHERRNTTGSRFAARLAEPCQQVLKWSCRKCGYHL